jgi:hypothetical protein
MAAQLNYTVVRLDLVTARGGGTPILDVPIGSGYNSVTVIQLPGGALIDVAFGETGEPKFVPLLAQGQSFLFMDDADCPLFVEKGLFVRNPVGVGTVILLVGFRSSGT